MLDAAYWNDLYLKGDTGWDKGAPSPPLMRLLDEGVVPKGASIAVVGAGRGHDALGAAQRGFRVTAIDYAPEAVKALKEKGLDARQEDVFALQGPFDAIMEHTCFCAIDVERRPEYVTAIARALKPGGTLFGVFFKTGKEGGPPFHTDEDEVRRLFAPRFTIERLRLAPDSFEVRAGRELEFVFRLSPSGT